MLWRENDRFRSIHRVFLLISAIAVSNALWLRSAQTAKGASWMIFPAGRSSIGREHGVDDYAADRDVEPNRESESGQTPVREKATTEREKKRGRLGSRLKIQENVL
jgi:hypothetical protein